MTNIFSKLLTTFFILFCVFQFLRLCLLRMSTIYEPCYLLHEWAACLPEIRLTAIDGALSMTTHIAHKWFWMRVEI